MNVRRLLQPRPQIKGAEHTDFVACDLVLNGELLAGYEFDDRGNARLTHLEAGALDILQLVAEVPAAVKQIEERLTADFWPHRIARAAEDRAADIYDARRA